MSYHTPPPIKTCFTNIDPLQFLTTPKLLKSGGILTLLFIRPSVQLERAEYLYVYAYYLVDMNLCVRISNQFPFQRIEGQALIRGVGAYLRVAFIKYSCAQGGRLLEGVLNRSITVHKLDSKLAIVGLHFCINSHYNQFCKEIHYET